MFGEEIQNLKEKNLFRDLRDRGSSQGPRIKFSGKVYINFSSNDYLGLANHCYVVDKVRKALDEYGFGSGASRLMGGGSELHKELEDRIAKFKTTEAALIFNSGYAANTGIIPTIADRDTTIFSDEFNHASIIDGCRLSGSKTLVYRHRDMTHLEELLRRENSPKKLVVTDTVLAWMVILRHCPEYLRSVRTTMPSYILMKRTPQESSETAGAHSLISV